MTLHLLTKASMDGHHEVVTKHHRFESRVVGVEVWDFSHLEAFALKVGVDLTTDNTTEIDVIVLFANHCFTRELRRDEIVATELIWQDSREIRVLDRGRYELSVRYLPQIILDLPQRHVRVADHRRPNFVTFEIPPSEDWTGQGLYAVFFEVEKDARRRKRVLLRIQSAYLLQTPKHRLLKAEKINFHILLKNAYKKK